MRNDASRNLMSVLRRRASRIALLALLAILPTMGGCYGRFPLTKAVYKFNGEVSDNTTVQNIFFWVLIILPVYELCNLGDAIIFNLVEYWTGDPVNLSSAENQDGSVVALEPTEDGKELKLTVTKEGKVIAETRFVKIGESTFEVRDARNRIAGMVIRQEDGSFNLTDAKGNVVKTIHPTTTEEVAG